MRSLRSVAYLALLAGCSSEAPKVRLDLPVTAEDRAALVLVRARSASEVKGYALALVPGAPPPPVSQPFDTADTVDVVVFLYRQPLDALLLEAGPLPLVSVGRPVPLADHLEGAVASTGGATDWVALSTPPDWVAAQRLPSLSLCERYDALLGRLPRVRAATMVRAVELPAPPAGMSGRGFLVATEDRHAYYVETSTVVELTPTIPEPCGSDTRPEAQYYDAYAEPASPQIWLVSRCGEVHRASIDLTRTRLDGGLARGATHRDALTRIAGPAEGAPSELFVLSGKGDLDRIELAGGVSELSLLGTDGRGDLAYLGPGSAAYVWNGGEVLRAGGGELRHEPVEGAAHLIALLSTTEVGLLAADQDGSLYADRFGGWHPLPGGEVQGGLRALAGAGPLIFALASDGQVIQYAPADRALCAEAGALAGATKLGAGPGRLLALGDDGRYLWLGEHQGP